MSEVWEKVCSVFFFPRIGRGEAECFLFHEDVTLEADIVNKELGKIWKGQQKLDEMWVPEIKYTLIYFKSVWGALEPSTSYLICTFYSWMTNFITRINVPNVGLCMPQTFSNFTCFGLNFMLCKCCTYGLISFKHKKPLVRVRKWSWFGLKYWVLTPQTQLDMFLSNIKNSAFCHHIHT